MLKIEKEIIEEFQSSPWGHIRIREAISIAKDLTEHKKVYCFKKRRRYLHEGNRETFVEGWEVSASKPNYYHSIGSTIEKRSPGDFMITVRSPSIKNPDGTRTKIPKENSKPDTRFWSTWYNFNQMFGDLVTVRIGKGEVFAKRNDKLIARIKHWDDLLAMADGRPMIGVLGQYTPNEINMLLGMSKNAMQHEIDLLKKLVEDPVHKVFNSDTSTLLTKGMDGEIKTARSRLLMRIGFWEKWLETGEDIFSLAKTYSMTTTKWDSD